MSTGTSSGLGTGMVLIAAGAILSFALEIDIPYIDEGAFGIILMVVGVVAVGVSIAMAVQSTKSRHVVEHRNTNDQYGSAQTYQRY